MKLLDLFSGIGGFSLGAEYNNIETIGFVEKDEFCQKVLRKHWPNTPIIGNIRDVTKDTFESVDIVSGGFPCQPFSVAGKRRGTDDDRYLWDETIRVVSLYKPRWFVGENVEGIVNIQNGMVLRQVQDDLEKEGFEVQCGIIPASGIGAWHQRKRVWIIGCNVSNTHDSRDRASRHGSQRKGEKNAKEGQDRPQFESSRYSKNDVSNTNSSLRRGRATISQGGKNKIWGFYFKEEKQNQSDLRSETIRCDVVSGEQENILYSHDQRSQEHKLPQKSEEQTLNSGELNAREKPTQSWWEIESSVCTVPDGVSYRLDKDRVNQIKSLGNSIVPQIAYQIFKAIVTVEKEKQCLKKK